MLGKAKFMSSFMMVSRLQRYTEETEFLLTSPPPPPLKRNLFPVYVINLIESNQTKSRERLRQAEKHVLPRVKPLSRMNHSANTSIPSTQNWFLNLILKRS